MKRALYAIYRTQQEGVDLKGIYWWSLMNNWGWGRTWDHNFGICHNDGTPREGAKPLLQLLQAREGAPSLFFTMYPCLSSAW